MSCVQRLHIGRLIPAAAIAALAGGCAGGPREAITAPPPGDHAVLSNEGTYRILYSPGPDEIPLNELFSMRVQVLDAARAEPDADASLDVDAAMPAHRHGMYTRARVRGGEGGVFVVEGMLLHMPGAWEIYFDVTRDGITERAQVAVELE